jgi:hypothetical protein
MVEMGTNPDEERYCLKCGYFLHGLIENRCPECGRSFDLADPRTFAKRLRPHAIICWLSQPLGWPTHTFVSLVGILTIYSVSVPGGYFGLELLSGLGWLGAGFIWLFRIVSRGVIIKWYGSLPEAKWGQSHSWIVAPLLFFFFFFIARSSLAIQLGFRISKPAMDRLVRETTGLPPNSKLSDRWVGIYFAEGIETLPGGVRFFIRGSGFIDRDGFAYSSQPLPTNDGDDKYTPLRNGWYLWHWKF